MGGYARRFEESDLGRFVAKFNGDLASYWAMLIAWQSLFSLFPLIAGFLAIFGLVLRDPAQRLALAENVASQFPSQLSDLLGFMEETRQLGGLLGLISAIGLLWTGYWLFDTMAFVFNRFYGTPERSYLCQLVMALTMMAIYVGLITVSLLATGISAFLVSLSEGVPLPPWLIAVSARIIPFETLGGVAMIGWLISLSSAILMFLALYRFVPNAPLGLADVWRGAVLAGVLFLLLNQVFPLYLRFFAGGYAAYKTLGLFLLLMTWFYFLAMILVLGAELNAFLANRGATTEMEDSGTAMGYPADALPHRRDPTAG